MCSLLNINWKDIELKMAIEFQLSKIALPDHPCQRCPSSEWITKQGMPSYCARCKHPYPKYVYTSEEEQRLYQIANQSLNDKDYDFALERFHQYVQAYPKNPDGMIGLLLSTYKISYELDQVSGSYIPKNHDIQLPPNLDKEVLFKDAMQTYKTLGDDEACHHWQALAVKLNDTIRAYNLFIKDAKPCEIFISFKHTIEDSSRPGTYVESEDVHFAQQVYDHLLTLGFNEQSVFFSKIDNKQYTGDFEAKIYYKLQTAKQLILIGSSQEYLDSPWVKNEWSRYLMMMKQGQKHPESLVVLVKDPNQLIQKMDTRLKKFNLLDLNDSQSISLVGKIIKQNQEKILGFTPLMSPIALESLMNQSETIEEEAKFLKSKSTIRYQKNNVTDFEKIEVNRLEIEWSNRNLSKVKLIATKLNQDFPNNATALKYLFMLEAKIDSLDSLESLTWMNDKEDLQTLFNYLTALSYAERTPLIQRLMTMSILALQHRLPLVYPLISFFLLTDQLLADQTILTEYTQSLHQYLMNQPDFSLFEIYTNHDKKEVTEKNLPLYFNVLGKINQDLASSVSLKYLIRILKYNASILDQPFPYHIFKRVLFFELNRLIKSEDFSTKTSQIILQIGSYLIKDRVAFELHHLMIRHCIRIRKFNEADTFVQQLHLLGEQEEFLEFYRFLIEQRVESLQAVLMNRPDLDNAIFDSVANRLLSSDHRILAQQWLAFQEMYQRVTVTNHDILESKNNQKDYLQTIRQNGQLRWQYKPGLLVKNIEGTISLSGQAIVSNEFFEALPSTPRTVTLGQGTTLIFTGSYRFSYPINWHIQPGVFWIDGEQTFQINTPLTFKMPEGSTSDSLFIKIRFLDLQHMANLGDAYSLNQLAIINAIGLEKEEDLYLIPSIQKNVTTLMLTQNLVEAKSWFSKGKSQHVFIPIIVKSMIDIPLKATASLMLVLSGKPFAPKDKILTLLKQAKEDYFPEAMNNLAYFYFFGEGVEKNVEIAAELWMKAIERGESFSETALYNAVLIHQELLNNEKIKEFILLYKKEVFKAKEVLEKSEKEKEVNTVQTEVTASPKETKEAEKTPEVDLWIKLEDENKTIAKETFAKLVDRHLQGDEEASLLLAEVVRRGFRYAPANVSKALNILEVSCLRGHQPSCKTFISLVREGVNQKVMQPSQELKTRVLTIQKALQKD